MQFRPIIVFSALWLIAGLAAPVAGQSRLVTFSDGERVLLRWTDPQPMLSDGYHVYRQVDGGSWNRLTEDPLVRKTDEDEIEAFAGHKTDLYLGLFGLETPRDLTDADYRQAFQSEDASLLHALLVANPEFGPLMGQVYEDRDPVESGSVRYRVTALRGGGESDLVTSAVIAGGAIDTVPPVDVVDGVPGNESARIVWLRDQATLDTGSVIGYNIYRSESPLGPFTRVNAGQVMPFSIRTEGGSDDRERDQADVLPFSDGADSDQSRGEFVDRWLENGTEYFYRVRSVNPFGTESAPSPTVSVVPRDTRVPDAPHGIAVEYVGGHAEVTWQIDRSSPLGVEVFRSTDRGSGYERVFTSPAIGLDSPDLRDSDTMNLWIDREVTEGGHYYYWARSVNDAGVKSECSDTVSFFVEDRTPPARPSGVDAVGWDEGISVSWDANDEADLLGYEVERTSNAGGATPALLTDSIIDITSWLDRVDTLSQTTYGYVVYAIDESFNRSAPSKMVFAQMPDVVPPQVPILTGLRVEEYQVVAEWTPAPEPDVMEYRVYRADSVGEFRRVGVSSIAMYADDPTDAGLYRYAVSSVDSAGNESEVSEPVRIVFERESVVPPPSALRVTEEADCLLVSWEPVDGAAGYVLHRTDVVSGESVLLADLKAGQVSFKDWHADAGREYIYSVQSRDERWVISRATEYAYSP